ncbi:hypothetical protein MRB53_013141 [Persea americana]|uniref:Uncharacterized protein n=1 Tax=Persea americana TaxID=3435 RepID=A0ACC2K7B8_PERAE|nr:hypothetical protein MRB53_013141 [Persea americana]
MEQEEYTKEEIDWSYIEFVDNQDVLDLIEKKPGGIIALLDEACMFPRSTYETFVQKLYQTFKNHKRFSKPKLSTTAFTISHYAGDVTYQTELFLDKNKDYVVAEHQALLSASECSFVSGLFPPLAEESSKSSKFSSIGSRFKQQLQALLETLSATEPHYIRCVKPNNLLKPSIFENTNVLQQLRCGGVMEAIRISCAGYPTRRSFYEFINRFGILCPNVLDGSCDEATASKRLLEKVDLKGYQIGKTKVFLRAGQMAELDARRTEVLGRSAALIQRKFCSHLARKIFKSLRQSAVQIQAVCRGQLALELYERMRRENACLTIQKELRKFVKRKAYKNLFSSAVTLQSGLRGMAARNELKFRQQTKAAIIIQSRCRQFLAHSYYKRLKKAAVVTQCAWRGRLARRELRKLKMAAKETGALQAAKTMLEQQVEELTWRLQQEEQMQADVEAAKTQENAKLRSALEELQLQFDVRTQENAKLQSALQELQLQFDVRTQENAKLQSALQELQLQFDVRTQENAKLQSALQELQLQFDVRTQENAKLQSALQELQLQFDVRTQENAKLQSALQELQLQFNETEAFLVKEKENPKKVEEQVPIVQEVPVVDTAQLDNIIVENEKLKDMMSSLERKIDETERKYEETQRLSEERLKKAVEAESKMKNLKTAMQRLEEKLSEVESENKILQQQALLDSSVKRMPEHSEIPETKNLENGHHENEDLKSKYESQYSLSHKDDAESENRLRRSHRERQNESVDALINCVVQNIGFSEEKSIAAFTIYKCLLHWRSFEAEKTSVFDRLIQMIGSAIESQENNEHMAYWLSSTSTLLFLLQRSLKATGASGSTSSQKPPPATTLFGRMAQGFRSSSNLPVAGLDVVRQVEAKYPALLFKMQLTAYVEKIYGIVRDNTKKELSNVLALCVQETRTSRAAMLKSHSQSESHTSSDHPSSDDDPKSPWQIVIGSLNTLLNTLQKNYVPSVLIQKIFTQIFSYINVQLLNSLLVRRECCSFSNGEYVKAGLDELELWSTQEKMYAGLALDELKHVRQAVGFLVIHQKARISYDDISSDLCPVLSVQQIYRICTNYWDDKYGTHGVHADVISSMRVMMTEDMNTADSSSFLLEDTSSIPFSTDDLSDAHQLKDFSDVKPAAELLKTAAFQFLLD